MDLDVIPTGKTTATVILTQEQVDTLRGSAGRSRVPVAITYEGQVFRTSISVYRGQWMMVVNQHMRDGGLTPPGTYAVDVVMDQSDRVVDVPDDLAAAITAAGLTAAWERQSYTNRKEFARGVVEAKKPETRLRRIEKIVATLGG
jgi:Bacteriocin-protection, YdeI or OmpD-Associated